MIGSGASGLAAAFRLQQAGHRVRILERADRLGSKLRSRREGDFVLDQGAFFLASTHHRMLRIIEEAGLLDQICLRPLVIGALRDGKVHELDARHVIRDLRRGKLLSRGAKRQLLRLLPEVSRARRYTSWERMPRAAIYDGESAQQWAQRALGDEASEYLVGASLRALCAADADSCSRVEVLSVIRLLVGAQLVTLHDGMGVYPARLEHRFEIELGACALEVRERLDGVSLTWRDAAGRERTELVPAVVVAVPAHATVALLPTLDDWRSGYLDRVTERDVLSVNVASSSAPRGIGATFVQVPRSVHPFLGGIVFEHNKAPNRAPDGAGLLTLVALSDWSSEHAGDSDAEIGRELLNALEAVLPQAISDVGFVGVNRWSQQFNPIGHYRELAQWRGLCERLDRRVQCASGFHGPQSLESATAAGEAAARRLLGVLSHHHDNAHARAAAMREAARA